MPAIDSNTVTLSPVTQVIKAEPSNNGYSHTYKVLRCDDPEKLLNSKETRKNERLLKVASVLACLAVIALLVSATAFFFIVTGGLGGTLLAAGGLAAKIIIGESAIGAMARFMVPAFLGLGLADQSIKLSKKAKKNLNDLGVDILRESLKLKKDPTIYAKELERLRSIKLDKLDESTYAKMAIVREFLLNPPVHEDRVLQAQCLIQLRDIFKYAGCLNNITITKQLQQRPIEWDKYGNPTKFNMIEVIYQEPSRSVVNFYQEQLHKSIDNLSTILKKAEG